MSLSLGDLVVFLTAVAPDVVVDTTTPDYFFMHPGDRMMPFATIVTRDTDFDSASNLSRPGVFRLNIGLDRERFLALFGQKFDPKAAPGYDFSALDQLMPNPVYGSMYWSTVLCPSQTTLDNLRPDLTASYQRAARRAEHRQKL